MYGKIEGGFPYNYTCYEIDDGIFWDTSVKHAGATVPGGVWKSNAVKVRLNVYESCCKKCAGPISARQQMITMFNFDLFIQVDQNQCDES